MKKWLLRHIFRHIPWYFPTQIQQNILWDSPRGSGIHPIWVRLKTCFISRDDDGGDDDDDHMMMMMINMVVMMMMMITVSSWCRGLLFSDKLTWEFDMIP